MGPAPQPRESQTLTQRNIYIVPSRAGLVFCVVLLLLLVVSINYQLSLGFALTFLLAGSAAASMQMTHGSLRGLTLHLKPLVPAFDGEAAVLEMVVTNPGASRLGVGFGLDLGARPIPLAYAEIAGAGPDLGAPELAGAGPRAARRCRWCAPSRATRSACSAPGRSGVRPASSGSIRGPRRRRRRGRRPRPRRATTGPPRAAAAGTEFEGVRAYRRGDTLRQVVWKKAARTGEMISRETAGAVQREMWLQWGQAQGLDVEARLSRLAAWIVAADAAGHNWGLSAARHRARARQRRRPSTRGAAGARDAGDAHGRTTPSTADGDALAHSRWRAPSREARDTLFMVLLIGWTIAPHLFNLPLWVAGLTGVVLAWRGWLAWRQAPLPGRGAVLALLGLAAVLTFTAEKTLVSKDAGVTLLVVLMALKTLELRARRDALVVFFLGFFLVLTTFLYSQSFLTAVGTGMSVWGWLTALTLAHIPAGRPTIRQAAGARGPRGADRHAGDDRAVPAVPAHRAAVAVGQLGQPHGAVRPPRAGQRRRPRQRRQHRVAHQVRRPAPAAAQLYFRGPVLIDTDGHEWRAQSLFDGRSRRAAPPRRRPSSSNGGAHALRDDAGADAAHLAAAAGGHAAAAGRRSSTDPSQGVQVLDGARRAPAGRPRPAMAHAAPDRAARAPARRRPAWTTASSARRRPTCARTCACRRSSSRAPAPGRSNGCTTTPGRARARPSIPTPSSRACTATSAPPASPTRCRPARTRAIRSTSSGSTAASASASTSPPRSSSCCARWASPARLVTGYQGADPQLEDGCYIVRQSNAHAWAEYWNPRRGWVRADPTAAVAPDRIERGRAIQPAAGFVGSAINAVSPGMVERLRAWRETMDNRWKEWVLGYNRNAQFDLLKKVGIGSPDSEDLGRLLMIVISVGGAVRRRRRLVGLAPPHAGPAPHAPARVGAARAAAARRAGGARTSRPASSPRRCGVASARRPKGWRAGSTRWNACATARPRTAPAPDWRGVRARARALAAALARPRARGTRRPRTRAPERGAQRCARHRAAPRAIGKLAKLGR